MTRENSTTVPRATLRHALAASVPQKVYRYDQLGESCRCEHFTLRWAGRRRRPAARPLRPDTSPSPLRTECGLS